MNYHEYICEKLATVIFFSDLGDKLVGGVVNFTYRIVKGGNYHIKIKLHIRMISGDVWFQFQHADSSDAESRSIPTGVGDTTY